jgi:hypothetical protein
MKPMASLAGTERLNFQRYAWDTAMFVRVNNVYEEFVRRKRWDSARYAANEIERLLKVWKPTTPVN